MKYIEEKSLENFEAWSGGKDTLDELTHDECEKVESLIEETFAETPTDGDINDFLWFERDTIAQHLGYDDWEDLERDHNGENDDDNDEDDDDDEQSQPALHGGHY